MGVGSSLIERDGRDPLGLRNDSAPHLLFWFSHSWYQERNSNGSRAPRTTSHSVLTPEQE
jgi:hypothetical protein